MEWLKTFWGRVQPFLPKNWKEILFALIISGATALLGYWLKPETPLPEPPPIPVPVWEPGPENMGWIDNPEQVHKVAATLPNPVFAETPAGQSQDELPTQVYLWQAYTKKFARGPPSWNQGQVGSCVSFGTTLAIQRTLIVAIVLQGAIYEYKETCQENVYGGSRVQIGGGRIRGDGSVGAWGAQYVNKYGIVERKVHNLNGKSYDLSTYSESMCRQWGRDGTPKDVAEQAKLNPVKDITQIRSVTEAKRALANGYGIAVCSNQGFSMQRDSRGVAQPRGSWAHCMAIDGYHEEGGRLFFHFENSWGEKAHTGPVGWGDPPPSGFWADSSVTERMLRANDSWAFSTVVGFPSNRIDWFVLQRNAGHLRMQVALNDRHENLFALLRRESDETRRN